MRRANVVELEGADRCVAQTLGDGARFSTAEALIKVLRG